MFGVFLNNHSKHSQLALNFAKSHFRSPGISVLSQKLPSLNGNTFSTMSRGNNRLGGFKRSFDNSYMWNNMGSGNNRGPYGMSGNMGNLMSNVGGDSNDPPMWFEQYNNDYTSNTQNARVVNCGELRENNDGETVEISGRVQNQQLGRFMIIKDTHGSTQLVAQEDNIVRRIQKIPVNANITVLGRVKRRPQRQINDRILTGGIEVTLLDILSVRRASTVPQVHKPAKLQQIRHVQGSQFGSIKITSVEVKKCTTPEIKDAFLERSHTCGELGAEHVGLKVSLCGWICHNHFSKFIHLKDGYGTVQAIVPPNKTEVGDILDKCELDSIVELAGVVKYRPAGQESQALATGLIEVLIDTLSLAKDHVIKEKESMESEDSNETKTNVNLFTNRTHTCGQLSEEDIGHDVRLCGWLRFERMKKFVVLTDAYGKTQCVIPDDRKDLTELISKTPLESILEIEGTVAARPPNNIKSNMNSGEIEVYIKDMKVLNYAKSDLPFNLREEQKAKEDLRMQHRYLDLRFPEMQNNLRMRSQLLMKMREFLINKCEFVDVETPTLFRRTPGGAQEFIVPTQIKGKCYALTQSPQQLKQMLMVGGIDRYFQIARCYRDERGRSDRQPEFTQLDIEMSFVDQECIMNLIEKLMVNVFGSYGVQLPFRRMTYDEAMTTYGTDKPDTRYGLAFEECSEGLADQESKTVEDLAAFAFVAAKENAIPLNSAVKKHLSEWGNGLSKKGEYRIGLALVNDQGVLKGHPELFTEKMCTYLKEKHTFEKNDMVVLGRGARKSVLKRMGTTRVEYQKLLEQYSNTTRANSYNCLWITDFPLFEQEENSKDETLLSVHHPFTRPQADDIELLDKDPLKVRSQAFDLVLNGYEIGGGSVRIHERDLQSKILDILKIDKTELEHLLNALECGCPPHGGIALGIDRLMSVFLKTGSIRDVIAFPKTLNGRDQLSDAPTTFLSNDIKTYHLKEL